MSSLTHTRSHARRFAGALVAVAAVVGLGVVDGGADVAAARRTSSASIADQADRAVDALERWQQSGNPADYVRFVQGRDRAATLTAGDLEVAADDVRAAWADAPLAKQHAVLAAVSQLGVPYRYAKSEPGVGFDCSGLTLWAYGEAGVELPRVSRDQIGDSDEIDQEAAEAGDLVYYPGHIGIYLGNEIYVHAPEPGTDVEAVHLPGKSLRFGDAVPSLVDGTASVAQ